MIAADIAEKVAICVLKVMNICINNDEFCIENEKFCIQKTRNSHFSKTRNFVLTMMNFADIRGCDYELFTLTAAGEIITLISILSLCCCVIVI